MHTSHSRWQKCVKCLLHEYSNTEQKAYGCRVNKQCSRSNKEALSFRGLNLCEAYCKIKKKKKKSKLISSNGRYFMAEWFLIFDIQNDALVLPPHVTCTCAAIAASICDTISSIIPKWKLLNCALGQVYSYHLSGTFSKSICTIPFCFWVTGHAK